ncbi:TPA: glycosyltransferase [Streptococcus suis]
MRILHYTIGFSPARSGGLVQYVEDLISVQLEMGYEIGALYPANQLFFSKKTKIVNKVRKPFFHFELLNSLPLALFGGIQEPKDFMVPVDKSIYIEFLSDFKPNVIHVHTLIGLHKEFFEAANDLKIPIVFTTHDYYGLSPLPTFYYNKKSFHDENSNQSWNIMSADALSTKKLRIFQSKYYPTIRHILKKINRNPKHKKYQEIESITCDTDYSKLQSYYQSIFSRVSYFIFNSSVTKSVFEDHLGEDLPGSIVYVTNSEITNHKRIKKEIRNLVVAYIGPDEEYKGYFDYLDWVNQNNDPMITYKTYGHYRNQFASPTIQQNGRFLPNEKAKVYENIDILVVPSRWKETFGLVVAEAVSYGVRVVVNSNVGAKDILPKSNVIEDIKYLEDFSSIEQIELSPDMLMENHKKIIETIYKTVSEVENDY